jgi:hypothetical protein
VHSLAPGQSTPTLVASLPGVSWVTAADGEADIYAAVSGANTLYRIPRAGGTPVPLSTTETGITYLGSDAQFVIWVAGGAIRRYEKSTGAFTTLASTQTHAYPVLIQSGQVYWPTGGTPLQLLRVAASAGTATALPIDVNQGPYWGLAADADVLSWAANSALASMPLTGGHAVLLATRVEQTTYPTLGGNFLYWAESNKTTDSSYVILRIAK